MGGFGSGRRLQRSGRATTESCRQLAIGWLQKQGCLVPGTKGSLIWSRGEDRTGAIDYRMESGRMLLSYRIRWSGGEWEPVEQTIAFDRTPCHYGGSRPWFLCPHCCKRVGVLYGGGKYFLCRHCSGLAYGSQQEDKPDRLRRKARKIRQRLGVSNNLLEPILFKPKHMHQTTFDRLRKESDLASTLACLIALRR